jgi:phosphatidylglycerophosphatase A
MQTENFSPQESLKLIQNMIAKTRQDMGDRSGHFLLWGWVTLVACIGQYLLKNVFNYDKHYLVWLLVIPAIIFSAYLGIKEQRIQKASTYIGDSMKYLWMGMGISFFVLSMILSKMGWGSNVFPFFMLLYGLGTFISGKFLQFNPLVYGGLAAWAMAIVSIYFDYDYQILFAAAAILVSYIIPAYMLRRKIKLSHNTQDDANN